MQFGTVGLFRDVMALPHRESSHEHSTDSAVAAISSFHQGGLWFEDPNKNCELEWGPQNHRFLRPPPDPPPDPPPKKIPIRMLRYSNDATRGVLSK